MIEERFEKAWQLFCNYYLTSRTDFEIFDKKSKFHGPHFREESDIVFHIARFCYNEFGDGWVHLESPIYKMYFDSLEKDSKRRRIDIEVSSPESFMSKNEKRQVFAEVKWVWRGIYKARSTYLKNLLDGIEDDLEKLQCLSEKECCEHAFMCIVDEEPKLTLIDRKRIQDWEKKFNPVKVLVQSYPNRR